VIPPAAEVDPSRALLPEFASDADLSPDLTRYWIEADVEFAPENLVATIRGQARVRYVIPKGATIDKVPLMLFPNDYQYEARMTAGPALVNGSPITGETDVEESPCGCAPERPGLRHQPAFEIGRRPDRGADDKRFGITERLLAPTFYPWCLAADGAWQVETSRSDRPTRHRLLSGRPDGP
jgi:hypothetical protein